MKTIWKPQPKQKLFQSRPEYEALYGGAAGGGKSECIIMEALRQVHIPHYRCVIIRKTFPQLTDLIDKSLNYYPRAFPGCKYNSTGHVWTFPSGAKIYFGSMQYTKDRLNYQGKNYDLVIFDELTQFTWDEYSYLFSRNRPNGPGTRVYIRATANPGGIGHSWVKERFITAAEPGTTINTVIDVPGPDGTVKKMKRNRIFIPSSVFDNKALMESDPNYVASLSMLPEAEKKALLYGDWDSFSGQVFMEWRNAPEHYDDHRWTHVINDFDIPSDWRIYRGFDFGYAKPFAVGWYAVDHDGKMYRIREWYGCTGTPNEGTKITPQEMAKGILEVENTDPNLKGKQIIGIADPAIYDKSRGESVGEMMESVGVYFSPGDHTRIAGKMQFHYRLAFDDKGIPMFYCFRSCKHFIRTIPALVYDDTHVEDINTDQEDHIYDECRYVMMEHPLNPRRNIRRDIPEEDPLDLFKDKKKPDNYYFYKM